MTKQFAMEKIDICNVNKKKIKSHSKYMKISKNNYKNYSKSLKFLLSLQKYITKKCLHVF